jgi:hypothetical protein
MRIIIDIEGGVASVSTRTDAAGAGTPQPPGDQATAEQATPGRSTPPDEVLAAAAALGAEDAGPAPVVGEAALTTAQSGATEAAFPQAATLGDLDAGALGPAVAEPTPGVPPLPLVAPGFGAAVAAPGDDLAAGAAPGIPVEPPPDIKTDSDTSEATTEEGGE